MTTRTTTPLGLATWQAEVARDTAEREAAAAEYFAGQLVEAIEGLKAARKTAYRASLDAAALTHDEAASAPAEDAYQTAVIAAMRAGKALDSVKAVRL